MQRYSGPMPATPSPSDRRRRARRRAFWAIAADRLQANPKGLAAGRAILLAQERTAPHTGLGCLYRKMWLDIIAAGLQPTLDALRAEGDEADTMRSRSPFGWLVTARERAGLWGRREP